SLNSSTGLYTPPATQASPSSTIVTATSSTNAAISASMTLTVLPNGVIRLVPGQPGDYTDSFSNVWYHGIQAGGDSSCGPSQACLGYSNGGSWPGTTDIPYSKFPCIQKMIFGTTISW